MFDSPAMVLYICLAITTACVLIGTLFGPPLLDEDSRLFGAWIGLCVGGFLSFWAGVALVALHFVSKFW